MVNKNTLFFLLLSLPITLIISYRGATPDTQEYWNIYSKIEYLPLLNPLEFYKQTGVEIAFGWYSYLMAHLSSSKEVFFFVYSFLIFFLIFKTAKKTRLPYLPVLILYLSSSFFYIQQFMQIRQGLSTALVMYSIICLINNTPKNKKLLFYILMLFSILVHQTAIILIVTFLAFQVYENCIVRIKNKHLVSIVLICAAIITIKYFMMPLLINLSERIASYATVGEYSYSRSLLALPNIRTALILLLSYLLTTKKLYQNKTYRFLFFCLIMAFIFRLGFVDFAILNGRISTVVSFSEIFIIPFIILTRFTLSSRVVIILTIFLAQSYISLFVQSPIILTTYFTPLIT